MKLQVFFQYYNTKNDGIPNKKTDWLIVNVDKLNADTYEKIDRKAREYHKKHHIRCFYVGITNVERRG